YFAGNVVFRSPDFGDSWQAISPDLTTDDPEKQKDAGGPVWQENTTAEYHCTIISFAESPAQAGVLWAGTDDGNMQISRDGGASWTNVIANVPGLPAFSPVSHIEPSRLEAGTAYAAFDRHMFDDLAPHVFKTTDFGATWTRLPATGLPEHGYVWVLRQDPKNPRLLWLGTELGLYASYDDGQSWRKLQLKNLPVVAVHDILIHPRENDLILGTHGRAIWIFDDATPLQQFDPAAELKNELYPPLPGLRFPVRFTRYGLGDKTYRGPNPPAGALITYALKEKLKPEDEDKDKKEGEPKPLGKVEKPERVKIEIVDGAGQVIRKLKKPGLEKGLNRVAWDLRMDPPFPRKLEDDEPVSAFRQPPSGPYVLPGTYTVRLTVDAEVHEKPVTVEIDPTVGATPEALQAQFELASKLTEIRSQHGRALRRLDAIKLQLDERRELLLALERKPDAELEGAWKAAEEKLKQALESLTRPENKPRYAVGPRVSERAAELFGSVEDAYAAPTQPQREHFAELEAETRAALSQVDAFISTELTQLNQQLARADLGTVVAASPTAE
ncbi:MAG TPA: hypothetical protein VGB99_15815, partial [Acidobacteriota bacterium]